MSVVIPARNAAVFLGPCIDALLDDGFRSDDILVVNDGSGDDTAKVAKLRGISVLNKDQSEGAAAARNAGVARTTGDIVMFVDADVAVARGTREKVLDALAEDSTTSLVFGSYDSEPTSQRLVSLYRNLLHHHTHQNADHSATTFWTGLGAVKRSTFNAIGGFNPDLRYLEDIEFGLRASAAGEEITLMRDLQGKHLKDWTLRSMFMTDWKGRAVPWATLLADRKIKLGTLNTSARDQASAVLVLLGCISIAWSILYAKALAVLAIILLAFLALNFHLFRLLFSKGGVRLALASVVFHAAHYIAGIFGLIEVRLRRLFGWTPSAA